MNGFTDKEKATFAAEYVGMAILVLRQIGTERAEQVAKQLQPLVEFTEKAAE